MAKRSILMRALGLNRGVADEAMAWSGAPAEGNDLAAIFAALRTGERPWDADRLPSDTGAVDVLLDELDRLWNNPEP